MFLLIFKSQIITRLKIYDKIEDYVNVLLIILKLYLKKVKCMTSEAAKMIHLMLWPVIFKF